MNRKRVALWLIFVMSIGGGHKLAMHFYQRQIAEATNKIITSRVDFDRGYFNQTESVSKEGEVKLQAAGSWGASAWMTPEQPLSNGSALVSDDRYTYIMGEWNLYFARYDSVANKWKKLANTPYDAGPGSDMVVLGDYIYAIFGSKSKQRYFARYAKSTNTWEILPETIDKMADGASLTTDGTYIYCTRGNWATDFWRYEPATRKWINLNNSTYAIQQGSNMVYKDGNIYTHRGYYTEMLRYNIATDLWSTLASSPVNFYENHSVDLVGNYMYFTQDNGTNGFWRYQLPDLSVVGAVAINFAGTKYVAGALSVDNTGTGGNGLAGTYTVDAAGAINGITITSVGSSYTSMPKVTPRKAIYSVGASTAGTKYVAGAFSVDNTGTSGSGLAGTYTVDAAGAINGVTITNNGDGYDSLPLVIPRKAIYSVGISAAGTKYVAGAFSVDNTGTGGSGLAGTYTVNGSGAIATVTITNNGDGYTTWPIISPRKAVYSIGISAAGIGYSAGALVVNNVGTGGSGLAGTYTVDGSGRINGITITNNGDGYTSLPVITPQAGGSGAVLVGSLGSGATLTGTLGSGAVFVLTKGNGTLMTAVQSDKGVWTQLPNLPQVTRYVGSVYSKYENLLYVFRGAGYYDFWKYDIAQNKFLEPSEHPIGTNSGTDLIYNNGYLYAARGGNTAGFYRYGISSNTWAQIADLPNRATDPTPQVTFNDANRGVGVSSFIYYMRGASGATGTSAQTFIRYNTVDNTWTYLADVPATTGSGSAMVYPGSGDYIYVTRGQGTRTFYRYNMALNTWSTLPDMLDNSEAITGSAMATDGTYIYLMPGYGQTLMTKFNIGTTTWSQVGSMPFAPYWGSDMVYWNGKLFFQAGNYKKDLWEYTIGTNSWRRLADMQGYGPMDLGPYGGGSLEVDSNGNLWSVAGQGIRTLQKYTMAPDNYVPSGSWTSEEMDLTYVSSWGAFITDYTTPDTSTMSFQARVSPDNVTWTDWTTVTNNQTIGLPANRYIQFMVTLGAGTSNAITPILRSISFSYTGDTVAPTSPTSFNAFSQQMAGVGISQSVSYRYFAPYFTWTGATDGEGSGVDGYYVYYGGDSSVDPAVGGNYQTMASYAVNQNMVNGQTYYLRVKTKDKGGNVSGMVTGFRYTYNGVDPQSLSVGSSEVYNLGTTSKVEISGNLIKLQHKDGFWQQEGFRGDPLPNYGSNLEYVKSRNKMYLLPGRDTREFWEYDIPTNVWLNISTTPDTVYAWGASLVEGPSGYLYALRGKYTRSFWRYDFATNTWSDAVAADIPAAVNAGTDMVFDGSRYIYVLRANSSDTLYRYDTATDSWDKMANADFGAVDLQSNNLVGAGAGMAYDGNDTIYVTKGGGTNGFATYSISTDSWAVLPSLPEVVNTYARITYEASTNSIYYLSGYVNFYRYDIDKQTWTQLQDLVYPLTTGSCFTTVGTDLFMMRGGSDNTTGKFDTISQTWNVPVRGLFGQFWEGQEARGESWGTAMVKGANQDYYMQRGNFDDVFVKYNADSGEVTKLANAPYGNYHMGKLVYMGDKNKIMMTGDYYYRKLFTYDISSDTWSENVGDTMPFDTYGGFSMVYDGSRFVYATRGWSNAEVWKYDSTAAAGSRWGKVANAPATLDWGAYLVKKDNYIYTLRGAGSNPNPFYRMDVGTTAWTTLPSLPGRIYQGGWLADGNDGYLYATRGESTNEFYRFEIGTTTWSVIANPMGPIFGAGAEAISNGVDRINVLPGSVSNGTRSTGLYTYIVKTATTAYEKKGSYISAVHDLGMVYRFANISVGNSLAPNFSFAVSTRTSADKSVWSDWEAATTTREVGATKTFQINSERNRYIQVKMDLLSKDGIYSGAVSGYTINYFQDSQAPTNPSGFAAYTGVGSTQTLVSESWNNFASPYFDWPEAETNGGSSDGISGAGVKGYYVYFGVGATADPVELGTLMTLSEFTAPSLISGNTYYLRIKAADDAGNAASEVWQPFIYKYDNEKPTNPGTLVANPSSYTAANNFAFSWTASEDSAAGIAGYCYKTGAVGATESCTSDLGVSGISAYHTGVNTFYIRAKDRANNYALDYITSSYYYSASAPSSPQNLRVTPSQNRLNEFAFAWDPPEVYYGQQSAIRYYYSVNALPTADNVNKQGLAQAYLATGAYATQKGKNTMYVLAKDEAGNIDYNLYAAVDFEAESQAPGIPLNVDISDVSVKETKNWRLAVSWEAPAATGSGIANYKIYRSKTVEASCGSNLDDFGYISTTTGTSYVDANLSQVKYYYCVKACDSTNECSAVSSTIGLYPDGKWRIAPLLVAAPEVEVKTKTAVVSWSTSRSSSSFVKYGKESGNYGDEVGTSEQVSSHKISLTGLDPGTTYYYKAIWTDEDGNSGESDEGSFTSNPAPKVSSVKVSDISLFSAYVKFGLQYAIKATVEYGLTTTYGDQVAITTSTALGNKR